MPPGPNEILLFQNVLDLGGKCCDDLAKASLSLSHSVTFSLSLRMQINKSDYIYMYICICVCLYVHKTEQINKHSNNYYICIYTRLHRTIEYAYKCMYTYYIARNIYIKHNITYLHNILTYAHECL